MPKKKVFNGRLIKVSVLKKILPNKKKDYMEVVSHPGASIIVPVFGNKIVFIRQYRSVINEYIWELPAGIRDKGETPYKCAKRELQEETGFVADSLKKVGYIYTTPGFCDEKIFIFKAECKRRKEKSLDEMEIITTRMFDKKEIKSLLNNGKIVDSKTISALVLAGIV